MMTDEQRAPVVQDLATDGRPPAPEATTGAELSSGRPHVWRTVAVMLAALAAGMILSGGFWVVSHEDRPTGVSGSPTQSAGR
jgi:hypothetical protein